MRRTTFLSAALFGLSAATVGCSVSAPTTPQYAPTISAVSHADRTVQQRVRRGFSGRRFTVRRGFSARRFRSAPRGFVYDAGYYYPYYVDSGYYYPYYEYPFYSYGSYYYPYYDYSYAYPLFYGFTDRRIRRTFNRSFRRSFSSRRVFSEPRGRRR